MSAAAASAGYNPGAKVIWEEGIRIPPAKLYIAGKSNKALWDTISAQRAPAVPRRRRPAMPGRRGDDRRAQPQGPAREIWSSPTLDAAIDAIFDASERQMRAAIRSVPEGAYTAERLMDHDGIVKDHMIKVQRDAEDREG